MSRGSRYAYAINVGKERDTLANYKENKISIVSLFEIKLNETNFIKNFLQFANATNFCFADIEAKTKAAFSWH